MVSLFFEIVITFLWNMMMLRGLCERRTKIVYNAEVFFLIPVPLVVQIDAQNCDTIKMWRELFFLFFFTQYDYWYKMILKISQAIIGSEFLYTVRATEKRSQFHPAFPPSLPPCIALFYSSASIFHPPSCRRGFSFLPFHTRFLSYFFLFLCSISFFR